MLAEAGLRERDIKGVNLDTGSAQAALVSKGVDAAFGGYEWFKLRDQGLAKIVYSTQGQDPKLTRQAAAARCARSSSAEHPERCSASSTSSCGPRTGPRTRTTATSCSGSGRAAARPQASFAAEFESQSLAVRNSPLLDDFIIARYRAVVRGRART